MSNPTVIFTYEGSNVSIQCLQNEKMRDICQRYGTKIGINFNSLLFLYSGNQLNLELSFKDQANSFDKQNNTMKILVYKNENNDYACPKCGEKIKLNTEKFNKIISSNDNIKEAIKGIKFQIDNIINNTTLTINNIQIQLKNINIVLNTIKEDIKKNNERLKIAISDYNNMNNSFNNNLNKIQYQPVKKEPTYNKPENKYANTPKNKTTSLEINVIRKGSGITMDIEKAIITIALNVYQKKLKPMSEAILNGIQRALGGNWVVMNYPKTKPADFNITMVQGNCYLYFTVDNWAFQIIRI